MTLLRRSLFRVFAVLLVTLIGITSIATINGTAHANGPITLPKRTCAEEQNTNNCDFEDPTAQHCEADASTLLSQIAVYHGIVMGRVDVRFSKTCQTYWGRAIAYSGTPCDYLHVTIGLATQVPQTVPNGALEPDGSFSGYTDMVYKPSLTAPTVSATFHVTDTPDDITLSISHYD